MGKTIAKIIIFTIASPLLLVILLITVLTVTLEWALDEAPIMARGENWLDIWHYHTNDTFYRGDKDVQ